MRADVMLDIETLGTNIDATVFQIAGCHFNGNTGEIIEEFNQIIDLNTVKDPNVDGSTIKWWTDPERVMLLSKLLHSENAVSDKKAFSLLRDWLKKLNGKDNELYLWGNGIAFDNVKIKHQLEKRGMKYSVHFRNDRDLRTILELACEKSGLEKKEILDSIPMVGELHDAIADVKYQIDVFVKCREILGLIPDKSSTETE